ncbi:MAG TPA: hypothetical protein PKW79_06300 [Rhabdochlamydiaceae bacterium]|nr:hypothetical protein [Rhabdochlamydiaceae bacterium]
MIEEIEKRIKSVQGKGLERLIGIVKLCLPLLPDLLKQLDSPDSSIQKTASREARMIMARLQQEFVTAFRMEGVSPQEVNGLLRDPTVFTPEERKLIESLPQIVRQHASQLTPPAKNPQKKFKPPPTKA